MFSSYANYLEIFMPTWRCFPNCLSMREPIMPHVIVLLTSFHLEWFPSLSLSLLTLIFLKSINHLLVDFPCI